MATYSGNCGTNLRWDLNTDTDKLTISGMGEMTNWSSDTDVPWYNYRNSVKTVSIDSGATSIGNFAFSDCSSLTSVTIPDSVTSIGSWAFGSCSSLTSVTIGNGVTSIGSYAFNGCERLTSVTISDSVTSIEGWAFGSCSSLTSIIIPNGVTSIGGCAFYWCSGLASIAIPDSVTCIEEGAFYQCSGLTNVYYNSTEAQWREIEISENNEPLLEAEINFDSGICGNSLIWEFDRSKHVLTISGTGAMTDYTATTENNRTTVNTPWWSISNGHANIAEIIIDDDATNIGRCAFYNCSSLTTITLPNNSEFKSINQEALAHCRSLENVDIPSSVTIIGYGAFHWCDSLKSISISENVQTIGNYAFSSCSNLTEIVVSENNPKYSSLNNVLFSKDKTQLLCYPSGKSDVSYTIPAGVTEIIAGAFQSCIKLINVIIPNTITQIGFFAFDNCDSLENIIIPNSVEDIGNYALYRCDKLKTVILPNNNKFISITQGLFANCKNLENITIPKTITGISTNAFYACQNLKKIIYFGTKEDLENINIKTGNDNLINKKDNFYYWFWGDSKYKYRYQLGINLPDKDKLVDDESCVIVFGDESNNNQIAWYTDEEGLNVSNGTS